MLVRSANAPSRAEPSPPHVNLLWTTVFSVFIGFILASAFSAILVYAQELLPGKVGLVSGLFFGFAFGMGGLGSALLGALADRTNIQFVYQVCAYLPLIGLLTGFLPNIGQKRKKAVGRYPASFSKGARDVPTIGEPTTTTLLTRSGYRIATERLTVPPML